MPVCLGELSGGVVLTEHRQIAGSHGGVPVLIIAVMSCPDGRSM
jgi:hypothetical protein